MRISAFSLSCGLILMTSVAEAAPSHIGTALYNAATGHILFTNLTGPIGITVEAPVGELLPANATRAGTNSVDVAFPGAITFAQFAGFIGTFNAGNIIVPGTPISHLSGTWFVDFTSDQPSISFMYIPEPSGLTLTPIAITAVIGVGRRQRRSRG